MKTMGHQRWRRSKNFSFFLGVFGGCFFPIHASASYENWAEKTLAELTVDEKIGQLFVAPLCPLRGDDHRADWDLLIDRYHIGNTILKHSDPLTQVQRLNTLQRRSSLPLLVTADAEWGLAMQMQDTIAFPKNRTLGAIDDLDWIEKTGKEIGCQAKRVGIHLNLAPVADVNTNPANPIIGMRAFGDDPKRVAACVSAMVRGMQSSGILAAAKHFPGHGDTSVDSHCALPLLPHTKERLDAVEFLPFRQAIKDGVSAIMTAHLLVPEIDPEQPATLSYACMTEILQKELGFEGLIISDALNMEALSYTPAKIALAAFQAGCDLLLYGDHIAPHIDKIVREDIPNAWLALKKGIEEGTLSKERLDRSVLKILQVKERLGLHRSTQVDESDLIASLHTAEAIQLKKRLFQEAMIIQGKLEALPKNTAYLSIGGPDAMAHAFHAVYLAEPNLDVAEQARLFDILKGFERVVIGIHQLGSREQNYGFSPECLSLIHSLSKTVLCLFETPYSIPFFAHSGPLLIAFENDPDAQSAVLDILKK